MANITFDHFNKFILHDETDTNIQVQEVYNKAKDEEDFPSIAMTTDVIVTATGKDALGGIEFTAITLTLRNNWQFKCRQIPISDITIKVAGGNTIAESGNDRFSHVDNVHYEFGQSTAPALVQIPSGSPEPTEQEIRNAMTIAASQGTLPDSIDAKLNDILTLSSNDQEWIAPGLLKIYDSGGKVGGTTLFEFETRDTAGSQTFVIADVKQFIKTKG